MVDGIVVENTVVDSLVVENTVGDSTVGANTVIENAVIENTVGGKTVVEDTGTDRWPRPVASSKARRRIRQGSCVEVRGAVNTHGPEQTVIGRPEAKLVRGQGGLDVWEGTAFRRRTGCPAAEPMRPNPARGFLAREQGFQMEADAPWACPGGFR